MGCFWANFRPLALLGTFVFFFHKKVSFFGVRLGRFFRKKSNGSGVDFDF